MEDMEFTDWATALYYALMVTVAGVGMVFSILGYLLLKKYVDRATKNDKKK